MISKTFTNICLQIFQRIELLKILESFLENFKKTFFQDIFFFKYKIQKKMNLKLLDNTPLKTSITRQENSIYLLKTIVDKNSVHLNIFLNEITDYLFWRLGLGGCLYIKPQSKTLLNDSQRILSKEREQQRYFAYDQFFKFL